MTGHGPLDPKTIRDLDGLAVVRGMANGRLPAASITLPVPFTVGEVALGRVVVEGTPGDDHGNPFGSTHGGWSATLMDSAMTLACLSTVAAGHAVTTLEFKLMFARPVPPGAPVRVEATVLNAGRRAITALAEMRNAAGKLLVHATSTCLVVPLP